MPMLSDLRTDLVLTSPVVSSALRDELRRGERAVRVTTAVHSWTDFQVEWDFAGEVVVLDALLDDHVPLPLKVRALRRLGSRPVVLGPGRDSPFAHRAAAEGAQAWIEPHHGLAETADLIRDVATHEPPSTPASSRRHHRSSGSPIASCRSSASTPAAGATPPPTSDACSPCGPRRCAATSSEAAPDTGRSVAPDTTGPPCARRSSRTAGSSPRRCGPPPAGRDRGRRRARLPLTGKAGPSGC